MINHIMQDLETLDTAPSALVLSIGAVRFDPMDVNSPSKPFYVVLNHDDQLERGRTVSTSTQLWWDKQSPEAQAIFEQPRMNTMHALEAFTDFYFTEPNTLIWGNGADFDNTILASLFNSFGLPQPWKYKHSRCYRTLRGFEMPFDFMEPEREGTHHDALDDALHQAKVMRLMVNALGLRFP